MQQYRSKTAGVRPTALKDGQLFLNQADGVLCWPNGSGAVQTSPLTQANALNAANSYTVAGITNTGSITNAGNMAVGSTNGDFGQTWRMVVRQDQVGGATFLGIINGGVGLGTVAGVKMITGSANSIAQFNLNDNNGAPYFQYYFGPGITGVYWTFGGASRIYMSSAGVITPLADNSVSFGTASNRWSTLYAGTSTINTSDAREKHWRGGLNAAEQAAGLEIVQELGFYQWQDAVALKGEDAARFHFGVRAQAVWRIMAKHGLVAPLKRSGKPGHTPYAFLCYDEWQAEGSSEGEGKTITKPAGSRFGVRHDQLALFLIAALAAKCV
jgi:hypothetical protein